MNFKEYFDNLPEDETLEEWAISAAAFIGTLAYVQNPSMPEDFRMLVLTLFKRMPEELELQAREYLRQKIESVVVQMPEYEEGLEYIEKLLDEVEGSAPPIDPDKSV